MTAPLIQRLGLAQDARAIIINADDFGMCRAANTAIADLLDAGALDSTTLMTPCSWSPQALAFAAARPAWDVGVHLVLTSEWRNYRWRPLTGIGTTLVDASGHFPMGVREVELRASDADVEAELRAQLRTALEAGVDVTHLDNHMGSVYGLTTGRDFLAPVLRLAAEHGLPFRLPRFIDGMGLPEAEQARLDAAAATADALGVVIPDRLWSHPFELVGEGTADEETYENVRDGFIELLRSVPAGLTEIYLHPMIDDDELHATVDYAATKRGFEHRLLADPAVLAAIADEGLVRVGWRRLRSLQRAESGR